MGAVSQFDAATAVDVRDGGRLRAVIDPAWCLGQVPNGGYVLAIMLRAAGTLVPSRDILMLNGHFLAPPVAGHVELEVAPIRLGRTVARAEVRLLQDGEEKVRMLAAFGGDGLVLGSSLLPTTTFDPPPLKSCVAAAVGSPDGRRAPVRRYLDIRYDKASLGWLSGEPSGRAEVQAWVRAADGRRPDGLLVPLIVDVLPAAVYELGVEGWVPTVELTVHQVDVPSSDWLFCRISAHAVGTHTVIEDAELWDETGRLVAVSRQLALMPRQRQG